MDQVRTSTVHVRYWSLDSAIMQYGKDWKKVEQYVKTRSGSQVRSHAQKFFNKLQKTHEHPEQPPRNHPEFSETDFDI